MLVAVIASIFLNCLGQQVETFREFTFCIEKVRLVRIDARETAAAADTYLNHASQNNPNIDVQTGKIEVGNFLQLLRDINDIEYDIELNGSTDLKL